MIVEARAATDHEFLFIFSSSSNMPCFFFPEIRGEFEEDQGFRELSGVRNFW